MIENSNGKVGMIEMPETEVEGKAKRRQYTAEYKLRILREVEACQGTGTIGALLRREGLYSSLVSDWRRQAERGEWEGLRTQKRGPKADPQAVELSRLKRENERLQERLRKAELIIEVQKKVAQLLGGSQAESEPKEAS